MAQLPFKTAKEHYESSARNSKEQKENNNLFNLVGKFMDLKPSAQTPLLILEDFSLECHIYVRVDADIIRQYKNYMNPWYIFLFHQLKFTGVSSKNDEHSRKVYFGNANAERMTVFHLIENAGGNREFTFSAAAVPAVITILERGLVDGLRSKFNGRIQKRWICNLKSFYDLQNKLSKKKKDAPVLVSFLAQIVEFRHVQNKILAKVWDSSMPNFKVKLPITQANIQLDPDQAMLQNPEKDSELSFRSLRRTINVLIVGDTHTAKFNGKKPGDLVLFYNAKLIEDLNETFKIEMSQVGVPFPEKQFVYFLGEGTALGRALKSRLDPSRRASIPDETFVSAEIMMAENISLPSYDEHELRNQITSVNDFTMISERPEPMNYQIRCVILELFPRVYKTTDLIKMKCIECGIDETISNLFPVDPDGLRSAVQLYYVKSRNKIGMQCPACTEEGCFFYFEIIFLLHDRTEGHRGDNYMFACLEKQYAEAYFKLSPIEVVANLRDQEYAFLGKIDYLKQKFGESGNRDCYMIINKNRDFYNIKQIKISTR